MDDIHNPTVPSGPSTTAPAEGRSNAPSSLMELIAEKQNVEEELKALSSVLDSVGTGFYELPRWALADMSSMGSI